MRRPDDASRLADILLACQDIRQAIARNTYDDYVEDRLLQLAMVKLIEIIGEAANELSPEVVASTPQIPWRDMSA